jgi:hypothetical protein
MIRLARLSALGALAFALSACSATGPSAPGGSGPAGPEAPTHPAYETFDPAGYDAQPAARAEVVHDVPARLMLGRVDVPGGQTAPPPPANEPQARQVEGYRIQIFTSASRDAAETMRENAEVWWGNARRAASAPREMEMMVAYLQPYYRVRIGAFESREEADEVLDFVRRQYPEAFVVPDLVTIVR